MSDSNKLFEDFLDNCHLMIAYLDPRFNFIKVSSRYAEADNRDVSFFPGKNLFDLFPNTENEKIFRRVVKTGKPYVAQAREFAYPENPERGTSYWDWNLVPIKDGLAGVSGLILTVINVTEWKNTEFKLRESEEKLGGVFEASPDAIITTDLNGLITVCNPAFLKLTGFSSASEVSKVSIFDLLAPESLEEAMLVYKNAADGRIDKDQEFTFLRKDKSRFSAGISINPIRDSTGNPALFVTVITNITERKEASREILKLASLVEHSADFIGLADLDGRIIYLNEAAQKMSGFDGIEEYKKATLFDFAVDDDRVMVSRELIPALQSEGGWRGELFLKNNKSGTKIMAEVDVFYVYDPNDGQPVAIASISRNITRRKQIEKEVIESRNLLYTLIDNSPALIYIKDIEGRYVLVNRPFADMVGIPRENITGKTDYDFQPKEIADVFRKTDMETIAAGTTSKLEEKAVLDDGKHTFLSYKAPLFGADGRPYAICGISTDISTIKQAEESLRRSEARLSNAQRVAHMGFWDWNIVTNELFWSDEIYRIFGLEPQEFGATYEAFLGYVYPDDRELVVNSVEQSLKNEREYNIDHRIMLSDGEIRYVHEQGEVTRDPSGRPVNMVGTVLDITQRKRIEKERERLILDLQAALAKVKTLSGFIPICASCKKIRDDEGYWQQIEEYITEHSDVELSHGLCPECRTTLYPELYGKKNQ